MPVWSSQHPRGKRHWWKTNHQTHAGPTAGLPVVCSTHSFSWSRTPTQPRPMPATSLSVREGSVQEGERLFSQHGGGKREVTAAEVSDPNEDCGHLQASVTDEAAKEEPGSGCQHVRLQGAVAHPPPPTGRPLPLGMGMARNRTELLAICLPLWASKAPHLRNEECWFGQCCLNHPILTNQ